MRTQTVVTLGRGRDARVIEARVCDLRALLELMPDDITPSGALSLVSERLPAIIAVLEDCLQLPPGETVDSLSLSELDIIIVAWWKLHAPFFSKALSILGLTLDSAEPQANSSATHSPPSAQEESMPPGNGATDTSPASAKQ